MSNHALPDYPPSWVSDLDGDRWYIVYDEREGFTPAYALVHVDNDEDAVDEAHFQSDGRIDAGSETVITKQVWTS